MSESHAISPIEPADLIPRLDEDRDLMLVDVREPDEFAEWRIPGAVNIPLGQLAARVAEIPAGRNVVTVCAKGARAMEGARVLADAGISAEVLDGGMASWGQAYDEVEVELGGATVVQVRRRGKGCLSYVVGTAGRAVVIDPSCEVDRYQEIAERHGLAITHVFDTHLHADHLSGARELVARTGAQLVLNPADPFRFDYTAISDGMKVELSPSLHLTVAAVSTPGHTEGSTVYRLGDAAIFTGDTLFLESVGRPDLADQAEPYARMLYRSLHEVVLPLADSTLVLPAHYGDSVTVRHGELVTKTLGELRAALPALAYDEETFVTWALEHVVDRPPNYKEIVKFNAGSTQVGIADLLELELGPNRCAIAS